MISAHRETPIPHPVDSPADANTAATDEAIGRHDFVE
jgi:hypothetical protein